MRGAAPFLGGQRGALLDTLSHLARFGDRTLVVAGPAGVGKSTLLAATVARLREHGNTIVLHPSVLTDPEILPEVLAAGFGLAPDEDLDALPDPSVALIDDAHAIPREVLDRLIGLVTRTGALRLVLFADSATQPFGDLTADALAGRAGVPPEALHRLVLEPLQSSEVPDFFAERLGPEAFGLLRPHLGTLQQRSGGLPGRLEALAVALLSRIEAAPVGWFGLPRLHLTAIAVVLACLIGLVSADRLLSLGNEGGGAPGTGPGRSDAVRRFSVSSDDDRPPGGGTPPPETVPRDPAGARDAGGEREAPAAGVPSGDAPAEGSPAPDPAGTGSGNPTRGGTGAPGVEPRGPVPSAAPDGAPGPDTPSPDPGPVGSGEARAGATRDRSPPVAKSPSAPEPGPEPPDPDAEARGYTLQLAALSRAEAAHAFAARLGDAARVREQRRNGSARYLVLYGEYGDRAAAGTARLPPAVTERPWIRPWRDVLRTSSPHHRP